MVASRDEHIIICSICRRALIVNDTINNGIAFLSHLKLDHGIKYIVQQMTEAKTTNKSIEKQIYKLNH